MLLWIPVVSTKIQLFVLICKLPAERSRTIILKSRMGADVEFPLCNSCQQAILHDGSVCVHVSTSPHYFHLVIRSHPNASLVYVIVATSDCTILFIGLIYYHDWKIHQRLLLPP